MEQVRRWRPAPIRALARPSRGVAVTRYACAQILDQQRDSAKLVESHSYRYEPRREVEKARGRVNMMSPLDPPSGREATMANPGPDRHPAGHDPAQGQAVGALDPVKVELRERAIAGRLMSPPDELSAPGAGVNCAGHSQRPPHAPRPAGGAQAETTRQAPAARSIRDERWTTAGAETAARTTGRKAWQQPG